ncbi:methionine ABC transporter permease [Oscillospiraceae bacterium LTW-04]|nr:methionine ABC transporter permease [Oscillospiraceae bacterium MB24-C1]
MIDMIIKYFPLLVEGTIDTIYMTVLSTLFAYILGLPMGILLFVSKRGGIAESQGFHAVFGWIINMLRSIPFIILLMAIFPFTRLLVGTIIGNNAAIVPLVVSAAPFVARMVEQSLEEIDVGVIEAARCMGATNFQIVTKVLLVESIPGIIRGLSITTITLIGYGAMAGAVGAGGLGKIGYSYGFQRFNPTVMYMTVVLLVILVCIIQAIFNFAAAKMDKRNR